MEGNRNNSSDCRRETPRLLCSDLLTIRWDSGRGFAREGVAVLEDFSAAGASLAFESRITPGCAIRLSAPSASVPGIVQHCTWTDGRYIIGVKFNEISPAGAAFTPDHVLDPAALDSLK